jgi:hypothetical protein
LGLFDPFFSSSAPLTTAASSYQQPTPSTTPEESIFEIAIEKGKATIPAADVPKVSYQKPSTPEMTTSPAADVQEMMPLIVEGESFLNSIN